MPRKRKVRSQNSQNSQTNERAGGGVDGVHPMKAPQQQQDGEKVDCMQLQPKRKRKRKRKHKGKREGKGENHSNRESEMRTLVDVDDDFAAIVADLESAKAEYLGAVRRCGGLLESLAPALRSKVIHHTVFLQHAKVLLSLPRGTCAEDVCLTTVRYSGLALQHVPNDLRTEAVCHAAVIEDGCALQFVPRRFHTKTLCRAAVQSNVRAIPLVPRHYCTEEMYIQFVRMGGGKALEAVPLSARTEPILRAAAAVRNSSGLSQPPQQLSQKKKHSLAKR